MSVLLSGGPQDAGYGGFGLLRQKTFDPQMRTDGRYSTTELSSHGRESGSRLAALGLSSVRLKNERLRTLLRL